MKGSTSSHSLSGKSSTAIGPPSRVEGCTAVTVGCRENEGFVGSFFRRYGPQPLPWDYFKVARQQSDANPVVILSHRIQPPLQKCQQACRQCIGASTQFMEEPLYRMVSKGVQAQRLRALDRPLHKLLLLLRVTKRCARVRTPPFEKVCENAQVDEGGRGDTREVVPSWSDNADAGPRCQQSPHLQFCRSRHGKIAHKIRIGHRRYD